MKKKAVLILIIFCLSINFNTFGSEKITKGSKNVSYSFPEEKIYTIPLNQRKKSYSVSDFEKFYPEYLKLNKIKLETTLENDKTGMPEKDKLKYYKIYDITPKNVKDEIGCQVFKVNYTCESYIVYNSKIFPSANSDFTHFKLSKKEFVGDIKAINKKIKITTSNTTYKK